jgi:hypothetical protein
MAAGSKKPSSVAVIGPYGRHLWSFAFGFILADRRLFMVTHHNDLEATNDSEA